MGHRAIGAQVDAPRILAGAPESSGRWLSRAATVLIVVALALRVPVIVNRGLGDDEAEHLHAAWAVAQGDVPYRDFFQNHTPLLYYAMAPVFRLMGEDLRVIYVGRALMFLCILLICLLLYRIARVCYDEVTGLLAVLLLSALLVWYPASDSFRPDLPQTLLVLLGLWHFMRAWARDSRLEMAAAAGLLGLGFWVLTKTLFPLTGLALVFVVSAGLRRSRLALRRTLRMALAFFVAFAGTVALGVLLLWLAGALPAFLKWVIVQQFRNPVHAPAFQNLRPHVHAVFLALAVLGVIEAAVGMVRARTVDEVRLTPLLAGSVTAIVYLFVMPAAHGYSAHPFLPLAAMYGANVVRQVLARALASRSPARLAWAGLATLLLLGVCVPPLHARLVANPFEDRAAGQRRLIRFVLALTSPEDSVFDVAGHYIFRPHATYFYRLGGGVRAALNSGSILESEIIGDLRRTQCKVVIDSPRLRQVPPELRRFLESHYVPPPLYRRGEKQELQVLVAGTMIRPADLKANRATVSLVASTEYVVVARGGRPRVYLDGDEYRGPRVLVQGRHEVRVEGDFEALTIVYSRPIALLLTPPAGREFDRPGRRLEDRGDE